MNHSIKKIFQILREKNITAYLVGGYVRDQLLQKETFDIDLATPSSLEEVSRALQIFSPYIEFQSLFFTYKKYHFTITPFRIEGIYNHRKPSIIQSTNSMKEDSARRDFTMNAIYRNEEGKYFDFYDGLEDIKKKQIKCIGDPKKKLLEDPLRILRAIRFASVLSFEIDPLLKEAIMENKQSIGKISGDRICSELEKAYQASPSTCIGLIELFQIEGELGIQKPLIETTYIEGFFAQLCLKENFFSKEKRKRIETIKKYRNQFPEDTLLYKLTKEEVLSISELSKKKEIIEKYENFQVHSEKELAIDYDWLFSNQIKVKEAKEEILLLILQNKLRNNQKEIRQYLIKTRLQKNNRHNL